MPDITRPDRARFSSPPTPKSVAALCRAHDADGLAAVEAYIAARPRDHAWLPLARMLAAYADQRGWRDRAVAQYHALLDSMEDPVAIATLRLDLAEHAHRWTDLAAMEQHLDAAEQGYAALDDWELTARGLRLRALLHCDHHQPTIGQAKAQQALDLATAHDAWPAEAAALVGLSYAHIHLDQFAEAAACTAQVVRAELAATSDRWHAIAVSDHGYALRRVAGDAAALPWYERARALQSERRDPIELRAASANVAELYRQLGRVDEAETVLRHSIAMLESIGAAEQTGILLNNLGNVQANRDDHAAALVSYQQALRYARQLKQFNQQITACANLGESSFQHGDLPMAVAWWLVSGVLAYQMSQTKDLERRMRRLRKVLANATPEQKATAYEQALALGRELAMGPIYLYALARQIDLVQKPAHIPRAPLWTDQDELGADTPINRAVDDLIDAVDAPDSLPEALQVCVQRVWEVAQAMDAEALAWSLERLEQLLAVPHVDRAAYVALCCGGLVEQGADPTIILRVLLERLALVLADSEAYAAACRDKMGANAADLGAAIDHAGAAVAQERPELARAWWALDLFGRAGVAMLSRTIKGRHAVRANEALTGPIRRLADAHSWAGWLHQLLGVLDNEDLLVLHPAMRRGYRMRLSGVADNFQLHTLLADALIGDPAEGWLPGRCPDRAVVAAARGLSGGELAQTAHGVFNMVGWRGLGPDSTLADDTGDSAHWIWGEGVPSDIEAFEGVRVVLLGPPSYQRSWTAERRFSGLVAEARVVERLTTVEAQALLERMARAPR